MADEVNFRAPGPNGERLELNLKERRIGLSVKDLLPILVVLGAFGGGLLMAKILFLGQARGQDTLREITTQLNANNAKVTTGQQELRAYVDDALKAQTSLVHTQTEAIAVLVHKQTEYIEAWFSEMGRRQELMNHNVLHPERALPLRSPPPREEYQPEKGR